MKTKFPADSSMLLDKRSDRSRGTNLETTYQALKDQNNELELKKVELESTLKDLRTTQKQLIQAEKMASLGVLSAGIGHEINNPLNYIKGGVQGLKTELIETSEEMMIRLRPYMEIIDEGVSRAAEIVKSLGHFSHHGTSMELVDDLHDVLEHCLVIMHNKIKHRIKIKRHYVNQKLDCKASSGKLHQVFLNILSNAVDAIELEGSISIKTEHVRNDHIITISDTGCGIPAEYMSKISDPFFTTKPPGKGTGLGLFITSAIVKEHNGSISIESESGVGTSIKVVLPCPHGSE